MDDVVDSMWFVIKCQAVKSNQSTPILQGHGEADPLVSHEFGKMVSQLISSFNDHMEFKSYPGLVHIVSSQVSKMLWTLL